MPAYVQDTPTQQPSGTALQLGGSMATLQNNTAITLCASRKRVDLRVWQELVGKFPYILLTLVLKIMQPLAWIPTRISMGTRRGNFY